MRVDHLYPPWHRLNGLEESLRHDHPELTQMFARWEDTERAAAGEPSPRAARRHWLAGALCAAVGAELIAASLLAGLSVVAFILSGIAFATAWWLMVRSRRVGLVRREPRLRHPAALGLSLGSGPVSPPR